MHKKACEGDIMEKLKRWQTYVLMLVCILINLIGREFASALQLPFWLDAIGTIIAAIELGPVGGAICGASLNIITAFENPINLAYALVSIAIGIAAGIIFSKSRNYSLFRVLATAMFCGLLSVCISTPLSLHFYEGRTGNIWGDGLIDMISRDVNVPVVWSFLGDAFVNVPDKVLSVLIATLFVRIHMSITDRRKKTVSGSMLLLALIPLASLVFSIQVKAFDIKSEYAAVIYDTDDGLATMEINAIAQTPDGYVWAGTYAGLFRCDGNKFEEVILDERISNVMTLYVDTKGCLWIGTNDSGMAKYNPNNGEILFYTVFEGLSSNSIRHFCEDPYGNMFVATATRLCIVGADGRIKEYPDEEINGVRSMVCNDHGIVGGVTNGGELFFTEGNQLISKMKLKEDMASFSAVGTGDNNEFLVGTTSDFVVCVTVVNKQVIEGRRYSVDDAEYFNKIYYSEENNGYFYCCEKGNGFMTKEGISTSMSVADFSSSITDITVDYQGNVWFVSNKQGILRYSWNPFMDIFARANVDKDVVNCVLVKDGLLYVGTNSGLVTIDLKTYYAVPIDHPNYFKNVRIRDLMEDSQGNIWACTYGKHGLIELKTDGGIETYNERNRGTLGGKFRCVTELEDGTIVAATSTGLNFIRKGVVKRTMGEEDGLTTQVLTMVEIANGDLLVGTDGGGIMIISEGKIIYRYAKDDGMESLVILKIVPCGDGEYIYVTSNALYYYKDQKVTRLTNFPYKNNYDVQFTDDGRVWITSSAGIYIVEREDLINNVEDMGYTLFNKSKGLYSTLTANSHNAVYDGNLYLCCTDGVRRIGINGETFEEKNYAIKVGKLTADNEIIQPDENGNYLIPATSGRVTFDVAVLNFTLSNPIVHIVLEGSGDEGIICTQREIGPLSYMNLPYGDYKLNVEVYDSAGKNVIRQESFHVMKESQIFERAYFKAYLFTVCTLFVIFIGWMIGRIGLGINSLERWQKEAKIDPMTGFWNKGYTQLALEEMCKNTDGILMVIDLDNFKLVNDVFGHETGDKVLIKFAELIRSCIRDDDFVGRIGGDEFVTFIKGANDELAVSEKEKYLNEQILKSGEDIMGKEMGIPLGVSIGAVCAPEEGTDYSELFRKADKALYNVKQNGKHGYDMFRSSGMNGNDQSELKANGVAGIKMLLEERGSQKGAYLVDLDKLQMVYRLFSRMAKRTIVNVWIVQFIVTREDGGEVAEEVMQILIDVLTDNLRSNDVIAPNGKNQVILILTDISEENGHTPIDRIYAAWDARGGHEGYMLAYETDGMS